MEALEEAEKSTRYVVSDISCLIWTASRPVKM
jgi:hypothetical protein